VWLRDPEKARVRSNPRGGSLIYSTRPHDTARGCCCKSDTAVFRGRAEVPWFRDASSPGLPWALFSIFFVAHLVLLKISLSHTKGLKSSQTAVDLGRSHRRWYHVDGSILPRVELAATRTKEARCGYVTQKRPDRVRSNPRGGSLIYSTRAQPRPEIAQSHATRGPSSYRRHHSQACRPPIPPLCVSREGLGL